ncbi:PEP-CTERM sorting domain-containing protein [Pontiellaceae bacterium B12219]|nr:PEP-CTERM sorting domain-containing protein [Pontiellaceae bacterium B12219]
MKKGMLYGAMLLAPALVFGEIIVNDDFFDGFRTKTGLLDADWWSSSSSGGNSVEIDEFGLGLVTGSSGRGIHATFAAQTLAVGDSITVTYRYTTPTTIGNDKGGAFKVALMDFNNAGLAADLDSSSSSANPLYIGQAGYMADFDVNNAAGEDDISLRKHNVAATTGRFLGTSGEWDSLGSSADNGYATLANTDYVGVFSVTRTGLDSVDIFSSLSQGETLLDSHSETDSSAIANNFGMFGLWANSGVFGSSNSGGDPDNGITLTNVQVEVIPEPATLGLLGMASIVFLFMRRRMRR